jgi:hypothetical protein
LHAFQKRSRNLCTSLQRLCSRGACAPKNTCWPRSSSGRCLPRNAPQLD